MSDTPQEGIAKIRTQIDTIDNEIVLLLKKRIGCALEIGQLKNKGKRAKWDPLRERQIYERLLKLNDSVFPESAIRYIFHEIITTCRLSQHNEKIAFLGPEATFNHLAGVKYFGHSADFVTSETIEDIFINVQKGRTDYGIVPIENSIDGSISSTLDGLMKYEVKICGEIELPIVHNLVCRSGNIDDIETIAAHTQPLTHCREWLHTHIPHIPTFAVASTDAAAQMAANTSNTGAIVSPLAVKSYELQVAVESIEDCSENSTRYLIIGKESPSMSGKDKTTILVGLNDHPGALSEILATLCQESINLVKIESRPVKGKAWQHLFFLEMEGHMETERIRQGCERIKNLCSYYEWLGSFPAEESASDA